MIRFAAVLSALRMTTRVTYSVTQPLKIY